MKTRRNVVFNVTKRVTNNICLSFIYRSYSGKGNAQQWYSITKLTHLWCVWWAFTTGTCFIQKYMSPPLPCFKVNICPFPLPHFASIYFVFLWSFRCPNYIVTLPRYFSLRLPHLNITTGPPSDELDKNIKCIPAFFSYYSSSPKCTIAHDRK
jgi:hypothetical protein